MDKSVDESNRLKLNLFHLLLILAFFVPSCATKFDRPNLLGSGNEGHLLQCKRNQNQCIASFIDYCQGPLKVHHHYGPLDKQAIYALLKGQTGPRSQSRVYLIECLGSRWKESKCGEAGVKCFR